VYASYAATFLLKLVSPTFASFIDEQAAMRLVRETADVLEAAAVDEQHTPALCASSSSPLSLSIPLTLARRSSLADSLPSHADASFLRTLIDNKLNGPRTAANSRAPTRPGSPNPSGAQGGIYINNLAMANGAGGPSSGNNGGAPAHGGGNGVESYLKSRAPSLGPEFAGLANAQGVAGGGGMGGEFGVGSMGFPAELGGAMMGGEFGAFGETNGGFDSLMADDILSANGFWSSMLMVRLAFSLLSCSTRLSGGVLTLLVRARSPASAAPLSAFRAARAPSSATRTTPSPSRPSTRARPRRPAALAPRPAAPQAQEEAPAPATTSRSSRRPRRRLQLPRPPRATRRPSLRPRLLRRRLPPLRPRLSRRSRTRRRQHSPRATVRRQQSRAERARPLL